MNFRIADTFTASLTKLTGDEQKAVKTKAFDLQLNPANPGMQFHKLDNAKDKRFWSVRVSSDIRLIVHRTDESLLLCYVDHHDKAYQWAERRKLEIHPRTGAAQLVEIRERVQEIAVPIYIPTEETPPAPIPALSPDIGDEELLTYGVPPEWMADVRNADEDTLLELVEHLPGEAAEALLALAVGSTPQIPVPQDTGADPFEHPDAQRRFRVLTNVEELEQALAYPWEKWAVFLHPTQRELVERSYTGPARVSGSAGTGKTVVALHRAAHLARRHPDARVLLATFSNALAVSLQDKLRFLCAAPAALERIEVCSITEVALRLHRTLLGKPRMVDDETLREVIITASNEGEAHRFSEAFLLSEWREVVDAWQLDTWEAYRDVTRLGRKTRLAEKQRQTLWNIYSRVRETLIQRGLFTEPALFARLTAYFASGKHSPYEFAVIDEAQDISVSQLRFLAALNMSSPEGLFFAGDLGQRIFQPPFSWKSLGVDIRGRSRTLRINYRTSHQIRRQADRLLPTEMADVDGNAEDRRGTVSVFNGPEPQIQALEDEEAEAFAVAKWLSGLLDKGFLPHELGLFVRSSAQLFRARKALDRAGIPCTELDEKIRIAAGHVSVATMHLAKGLEFRAVAVMACDDEIIPLQERIEQVADDSDLEEVYNTERHLLYVACTRARDQLLITGVTPVSEFLEDMTG